MRRIFDNVVSIFVIAVVLLLIIPLPAFMLDVLLLFNMAIAMIILLITMYIKEALEFSIFPSILLVTTLFRAALNVSSARLILGEGGQAGAVIKTFGEFVIRGNPVVGFIIFLILLIIQFLIIVKGAERVAEVAARFTLDAMPGKQMAIDADLSTGAISEAQARERREKISRESEFYGSMDGATKFVKGDAIVSIILSLINIVGGIVIGFMTGVGDAGYIMSTYTIATVGDGLVSQIPALLISTATGMVVTRAASQNSLSKDVINQFGRLPAAFIITGGAMLLLAVIPGMPIWFLLIFGLGLISLGLLQYRNQMRMAKAVQAAEIAALEEPMLTETEIYSDPSNIYDEMEIALIEVQFGYSLLSLTDEKQGSNFSDRIVQLKRKFASDMGVVIDSFLLRDNIKITPNSYIITIRGEEVASGEILPSHYLIMDSEGTYEDMDGIETTDPAFGIPAKWIPLSSVEKAEMFGYAVIEPRSVIITHLSEILRKHAYELIGRNEIDKMLDNVRKTHKSLVDDLIGVSMTVPDFQKIIVNLLKEQIPVKDLVTIIETISEYRTATGGDLDMLTEYCRQSLKRTITRMYAEEGNLNAVFLDPELESTLIKSATKTAGGVHLQLEHSVMQGILTSMSENLNKFEGIGATPIVLTSPLVRLYFKQFIERFVPGLTVLSMEEIDPKISITNLGFIRAGAA